MNGIEFKDKIYRISYYPETITERPTTKEFKKYGKVVKEPIDVTMDGLASQLTMPKSYPWAGGVFNGERSGDNWMSQSVMGLDFDDNKVTLDGVIDRLKEKGITANMWYATFRSTPDAPRFRVIIFFDEPITDRLQCREILFGLHALFPEADPKCKELARWFLPGKEPIILDYTPNSAQKMMDALGMITIKADGGKRRYITKGAPHTGTFSFSLYNYIGTPEKLPTEIDGNIYEKGIEIDIEALRPKCVILDSFMSGEWLYENELFGLMTNMVYISGGVKMMRSMMRRYNSEGSTEYKDEYFFMDSYIKQKSYHPQAIGNFSPHEEDKGLSNLLELALRRKGKIEVIEPIEKIGLKEAEVLLETIVESVSNSSDNNIHIIKCPTGLGKSEHLLKMHGVVAVPNHDLKNELSNRMTPIQNHVCSPNRIVFKDPKLDERLRRLYKLGLSQKAHTLIVNIANASNTNNLREEDINRAREYVKASKQIRESEETVITTHTRAILTEHRHDVLIFDEDPLNELVSVGEIRISHLNKLMNRNRLIEQQLRPLFDSISSLSDGVIHPTIPFSVDESLLQELIDAMSDFEMNVFGLLDSKYVIRDTHDKDVIYYVTVNELPHNKKVIIMSATIPDYIYKALLGNRVVIHDIGAVEHVGEIIQYIKHSCSRSGLKKYHEEIRNQVGDLPVITYSGYGAYFANPIDDLYFGKCTGIDAWKGKDIAVVGTYHRNNAYYFLLAAVMGHKIEREQTIMQHQWITHKGLRFRFMTYDNQVLRDIQLSLIESELLQAVGRSRTLREKATVKVFSNFPLTIASQYVY